MDGPIESYQWADRVEREIQRLLSGEFSLSTKADIRAIIDQPTPPAKKTKIDRYRLSITGKYMF